MRPFIFKIASAATVLSNGDTWKAFHWNWTECSPADAWDCLGDTVSALELAMEDAWQYGMWNNG